MPKVDFSKVDDVQDFSPLPDGKYLCQVSEIEEATTQYDDEMWKLKHEVIEGEHKGRFIFDNLVFSSAALKRAKLICSRLGLDVSGEVELTPSMLKGRKCYVSVLTEEYEDSEGKIKKRNVVPFAGYEKVKGAKEPAQASEDDSEENMPF
jgi:hypothetical protein